METIQKCAFVTGGSHGIGEGIVRVLAREGYDIAFTYYSRAEEAAVVAEHVRAEGRRCFYYQASLQERDVPIAVTEQAIKDLGRLDVLVCNAGVTRLNLLTTMDADFLDEMYSLDFRSYLLCAKAAACHMREQKIPGLIVFITSTRGKRAYPQDAVYGALKAGLNRACESIALELSRFGIRCNTIAPGATATNGDYEDPDMEMTKRGAFSPKIPLRRYGHPYEIGHAVAYLASKEAAYITGVTLKMDGGLTLPGMPEVAGDEIKWTTDLDAFEERLLAEMRKRRNEQDACGK